jgi:uncharacterized protein YjbJ (UPF0337 family)
MDWQGMEDIWNQVKGDLRARWSRLTDEDLEGIAGKRELLIGRLGEIYGSSRERVEAELRDWERHQEPIVPTGPAK